MDINLKNPDKYVRKFLFNSLNNITVNGKVIRCYDSHNPNNDAQAFVVLSTQSGSENVSNKCYTEIEHSINLDIITRYPLNSGSRLLADDIKEKVLELIQNPSIENFEVIKITREFPADLIQDSSTETIFRKIIKLNFKLK